jgi:hypothetical protein
MHQDRFKPNNGQCFRGGDCISSAFMASAINRQIDKRMPKSQKVRWSQFGAHCPLAG